MLIIKYYLLLLDKLLHFLLKISFAQENIPLFSTNTNMWGSVTLIKKWHQISVRSIDLKKSARCFEK